MDAQIETTQFCCDNCMSKFPSRNQLFKHLRLCSSKISSGIKRKHSEDDNQHDYSTIPPIISQYNQIEVIQEDDDWYRVVVKPQGMATMGTVGGSEETLMNSPNMLLANALEHKLFYKKAVPCHRLDRATGGLVLCSKSKEAEVSLKNYFRYHKVNKRYRAIVKGKVFPLQGEILTPISGQNAHTKYQVISHTTSTQYEWITTIDLWPITGRKHQLRRHMAEMGHFIIGDPRYSSALDWPHPPYEKLLFLWSVEISFPYKYEHMNVKEDIDNIKSNVRVSVDTTNHQNEATEVRELDDIESKRETSSRTIVYPIITVSIDEPTYYEQFRQYQANGVSHESTL